MHEMSVTVMCVDRILLEKFDLEEARKNNLLYYMVIFIKIIIIIIIIISSSIICILCEFNESESLSYLSFLSLHCFLQMLMPKIAYAFVSKYSKKHLKTAQMMINIAVDRSRGNIMNSYLIAIFKAIYFFVNFIRIFNQHCNSFMIIYLDTMLPYAKNNDVTFSKIEYKTFSQSFLINVS
ncbi:Protein of unknown function [Gryllus bimaculatus]|nr:Protein of unknown function [Gryllus bimaculatus]